jgi:hypothetical protein
MMWQNVGADLCVCPKKTAKHAMGEHAGSPLQLHRPPDKKINFVKTCQNIHFGMIFAVKFIIKSFKMELKLPKKDSYDYQFITIIDERVNNPVSINNNGARIEYFYFKKLDQKFGGNYYDDILRQKIKDYLNLLQDYKYLTITNENTNAVRRTGISIEELYQKETKAEEERANQIQKQKEAEELDKQLKIDQMKANKIHILLSILAIAISLLSLYCSSQNRNSDTKTLQTRIDTLETELKHIKEKPIPNVQAK